MSSFQSLPPEAFALILSFLPTANDVASIARVSRRANAMFLGSEGHIMRQVLINQFGAKGLAMCVARYAAITSPWKQQKDGSDVTIENQDKYLGKITEFCDEYLSKQGTELRIQAKACSLKMASRIVFFDERVSQLAEHVAIHNVMEVGVNTAPSKTEITRVKRTFYILDIMGQLLHSSPVRRRDHRSLCPDKQDTAFTKFWTCFAPWENVQMEGLEWILGDLVDHGMLRRLPSDLNNSNIYTAYVAKHGRTVEDIQEVMRNEAIKMVLIMGVEALPPLVLRQEFPTAWEDLLKTLRSRNDEIVKLECSDTFHYPLVRYHLFEDVFRWFRRQDPANDYRTYDSTIDTLDFDRYNELNDDTGPRDVWLWLLNENPGVQINIPLFYPADDWCTGLNLFSGCLEPLWWDRARIESSTDDMLPDFEEMKEALEGQLLRINPSFD